ncbi:MAG: TetR/AcrR family transcriptional regulator, ethionamide resistance regulator [Frankiaceae bacterium]|nr:TetR/AcrR family transcriptional regulator, ethionamide resistance regulator [Frankiaceae bacterium]
MLAATAVLLGTHRFDQVSVADILTEAGVSRASFYFYFPSRQAVLAELVRRAVEQGHEAAAPWLSDGGDPLVGLRHGIRTGARLWRDNAGVLVAIVDAWGSDPELRELWLRLMQGFTDATRRRLDDDPAALRHLEGVDLDAVAASLTWLGERLYYLAASGVAPFNDEQVLVETLLNAWTSTLYGSPTPATRWTRSG